MPSQTFTSSGTWNCPSDYQPGSLVAQCWGPGGNGAAGVSGTRSGGGGGGGEFAQDTPAVTAGNAYTVTVAAGSGSSTTFFGNSLNVVAHTGGNASGVTAGSAGSGSTNATHFNGGAGGAGRSAASSGGAGGGSSAGTASAGSAGTASTSSSGAAGGNAPTDGGDGGTGGSGVSAGGAGTAPGGGGGGGGNNFSTNGAAGSGAPGQVILTWTTVVITNAPEAVQRPRTIAPQLRFSALTRATQSFVPLPPIVTTEVIRYPQDVVAQLIRHGRYVAPTAAPYTTGIQPPNVPDSVHRWMRPPYPRRGVTVTQFPTDNIPPTESYRARFKPPYPRRGVVAPTGWPVPVQPPKPGGTSSTAQYRRRRSPVRGSVGWPFTPPAAVQPPWSSWIYRRRWTRPLLPRKGVTAPAPKPFVQPNADEIPFSLRRTQRYQWFRRGNVAPTGWPIPVQPPETSQSERRWSKPLFPRRGVTPPTNIPEPVPPSWRIRRPQRYQWFRRGNAQPNSGLPVKVQPPSVPDSVHRVLRPPLPRRKAPLFTAFFTPVQPPERMQSVRRWSMPPWPRRGRTDIATLVGTQIFFGYLPLDPMTFAYVPGQPGMDLSITNLQLLPLNRFGFSFFNQYGDVLLVVTNNTSGPVTLVPNVIRAVEMQIVQLPAYTLQPGITQAFGPFPYNDFSDPDLVHPDTSYYMTVDVSTSDSGVYAGAFRMVSAPLIGHIGRFDDLLLRVRRLISQHQTHSSTPGDIHPGDSTPGA